MNLKLFSPLDESLRAKMMDELAKSFARLANRSDVELLAIDAELLAQSTQIFRRMRAEQRRVQADVKDSVVRIAN